MRFVSLALGALLGAHAALAVLPEGVPPSPRLVGPPDRATVSELALRFAWQPASRGQRHAILLSREPFETAGRLKPPNESSVLFRELEHPVASLAEIGFALDRDRILYWAAANARPGALHWAFSEVRACSVVRRFSNRVASLPHVRASPTVTTHRELMERPLRVQLKSGHTIDPRRGEPALPLTLRGSEGSGSGQRAYLVHYGTADPDQARREIVAAAGRIVAYIPDRTFLVRLGPLGELSLGGEDAWVGAFQPAYKLSPRLNLETVVPAVVTVLLFPDGDLDAVRAAARADGAQVLAVSSNDVNRILRLAVPGRVLPALARHPDVAWIEPYVRPQVDNASVQWVVQTNRSGNRRMWNLGLRGEGQVVMTSDTGVDVTHDMFRDSTVAIGGFGDYPTHRKVIAYHPGSENPLVVFGDQSGASYHGTHTACTAVGTDDLIRSDLRDGVAKYATLYFMDISGPALGNTVDVFPDLNDLFRPSYMGNAAGAARISSNSWGAPADGDYTIESMAVDQFTWSHPDYLIFFSNGNGGTPGSVRSPATAKNAVGVGATANGSSANLIGAYTSRGPTTDGRRKPTLCAPGSSVSSAGAGPAGYRVLSGTSMASPAMAGAAALIRQYVTDGWYPTGAPVPGNGFTPSAALLKAMCVNSGSNDLRDTQGELQAPDQNIGYGRIDVDSVLYFAGDSRMLVLQDFTIGLGDQQRIEYQLWVTDSSMPLEVTLCWTDYPGSPSARVQIVNDLDLTVTDGIITYRGNVYSNGFSIAGGVSDDRNVEEAVRVRAPAPGLWTIRIEGANVPLGPQPFGLCVTGGLGSNAGTVALDRASYGSASRVEIQVTDRNAGQQVEVWAVSSTEAEGEWVTLRGADGMYRGSIPLSPLAGLAGDGVLQVSSGDLVTVTYEDVAPAAMVSATAEVSFETPIITAVSAASQGGGVVRVSWDTDRNASSRVHYGLTAALGSSTPLDPVAALQHQVWIPGLVVGQLYYYDVESRDLNGNLTRDDNGGSHYRFTVGPSADLLLVLGAPEFERPERYQDALARRDWTYDVWEGPLAARPLLGHRGLGVRSYQAVWWQVGLDHYPPLSDAAREVLTSYLDGGGRLAVTGHDLAWSYGDSLNSQSFYTPERAAWLRRTLRTTYRADPAGWLQVSGIAGDPISGDYTHGLEYAEHRVGASGDEIGLLPGGGVASPLWWSGDPTPDACGLRWESDGPLGSPDSGFWGGTRSRLVAMYFEWTGIDPGSQRSAVRSDILHKTLSWLIGRDKPTVTLQSPSGGITVSGDTLIITWVETIAAGSVVAARAIEYSPNGGEAWIPVALDPEPSPYFWDLTTVANTAKALVRVRISDDGSPALSGFGASDATFVIRRPGGDAVGPVVVAGSVRVVPNPVDNQRLAVLSASVSDEGAGGGSVAAAEWSFGENAATAGAGRPMSGVFGTTAVAVSATLPAPEFEPGPSFLWVRARDGDGNWGTARPLAVVVNGAPLPPVGEPPLTFELRQNAPNPVAGSTIIRFVVPAAGAVRLTVHDLHGRLVRELVREIIPAGEHDVQWDRSDADGRRVAPGLYFYRLVAGGHTSERRMVALR